MNGCNDTFAVACCVCNAERADRGSAVAVGVSSSAWSAAPAATCRPGQQQRRLRAQQPLQVRTMGARPCCALFYHGSGDVACGGHKTGLKQYVVSATCLSHPKPAVFWGALYAGWCPSRRTWPDVCGWSNRTLCIDIGSMRSQRNMLVEVADLLG